jgi:hypothetical protein
MMMTRGGKGYLAALLLRNRQTNKHTSVCKGVQLNAATIDYPA